MATRSGAVRVSIFADTKDLERGAARGEQSLNRLGKAGARTGSTFAGASKHLIGFAAALAELGAVRSEKPRRRPRPEMSGGGDRGQLKAVA